MPNATKSNDTEKHDLKTLQGGYVELQRMSYGQVVQRRALMKMTVQQSKGKKDFMGEMAMASVDIQQFEFSHCIVDHNLEDNEGRKLNLSSPVDFGILDPRVGQEIETLIGKMNNFDEDEEDPVLGNSPPAAKRD